MSGAATGPVVPLDLSGGVVGADTRATRALDTVGESGETTATGGGVAGDVDALGVLAWEVGALVAVEALDEASGADPPESPQAESTPTNSKAVRCLNVAVVNPMNSSSAYRDKIRPTLDLPIASGFTVTVSPCADARPRNTATLFRRARFTVTLFRSARI
jgi:hypothetical protein